MFASRYFTRINLGFIYTKAKYLDCFSEVIISKLINLNLFFSSNENQLKIIKYPTFPKLLSEILRQVIFTISDFGTIQLILSYFLAIQLLFNLVLFQSWSFIHLFSYEYDI